MTRELFDYDKVSPSDYAYYGFHLKDGRYHIDTKRLKLLHCDGCFPEALFTTPRNTHYFIPRYKNRSNYAVNVLRDQINRLTKDWNLEYKEAINNLTTPEEVRESVRVNEIAHTSSADDFEDIEFNALLAGAKRQKKYGEVIKSIHLQYLQKIFTELFRTILLVIKERGYTNTQDFTYKSFFFHVQERFNGETKRANPLYKLPHYRYFDVLNKIDNFLKHNTLNAYNALANNPFEKDEKLKKFQSKFVYSYREVGFEYENGMYAGNWLKIGPEFVDETLNNLFEFVKEFCEMMYGEDPDEAYWNSDESLLKILKDNFFNLM